jgi:hypothetical protein
MSAIAFYGNSEGSEVFAIDIDTMTLKCRIPTGDGPYPVDLVGKTHVLASTRKENSVTPIEIANLTPLPKIDLPHKPRSSSTNQNGLILVSGADKPLTTVVDAKTWKVLKTFGEDIQAPIEDFGGKLASGHERWLADNDRFFLIDRIRRRISLYRYSTNELLWSANTPTSCHHIVPEPTSNAVFYAMCEGNQASKIPPSVMRLISNGDIFTIDAHVFLPVDDSDKVTMGGHHVDVSGDFLYCGSSEGNTYVFRKDNLTFITRLQTGTGNGHTGFIEDSGQALGISINHTAQFITIFDLTSNQPLKSVQVSNSVSVNGKRTQAHTSGKRGNFFYMMASLDSTFHEVDVLTGVVNRSLVIPADGSTGATPFPMQGVFIWDSPGAVCTQCC